MNNTTDLYSVTDVKKVRELLTLEQGNLDALTGLIIDSKQHCLDHSHKSMYVRSVLARQTNAALGKIENVYTRYLSYWYPHSLPTFLRQAADYLEREDDKRWYHPMWLKKIRTEFNKLSEHQKKQVLIICGKAEGKNGVERKKLFDEVVKSKIHGFDSLRQIIDNVRKE